MHCATGLAPVLALQTLAALRSTPARTCAAARLGHPPHAGVCGLQQRVGGTAVHLPARSTAPGPGPYILTCPAATASNPCWQQAWHGSAWRQAGELGPEQYMAAWQGNCSTGWPSACPGPWTQVSEFSGKGAGKTLRRLVAKREA